MMYEFLSRWGMAIWVVFWLIVLVFAIRPAEAQQACPPQTQVPFDSALVCWVNADKDVNGNPIPTTGAGALTQTRVQRSIGDDCDSSQGEFIPVEQTLTVSADVTMVLFEGLPLGKNCFRARHLTASDASTWSGIMVKVVAPPPPPEPAKPSPPAITVY